MTVVIFSVLVFMRLKIFAFTEIAKKWLCSILSFLVNYHAKVKIPNFKFPPNHAFLNSYHAFFILIQTYLVALYLFYWFLFRMRTFVFHSAKTRVGFQSPRCWVWSVVQYHQAWRACWCRHWRLLQNLQKLLPPCGCH